MFRIECLDNAQAAECLLDGRHQRAPLLLSHERRALQPLAYAPHHESSHWQQHKHKNRQLPTNHNHHAKTHDNHYRILEHHIERRHNGVFHLSHVARHTRHNVALALAREEADGKAQNLVVDKIADVAHDSRTNRNQEIEAEICGAGLECGHHHECHSEKHQGDRRTEMNFAIICRIVEIIDCHVLKRAACPVHIVIDHPLAAHKEHLENRDYQCKGEKRQKRRQDIEENVEKQIFLVWRHKAAQYFKEFFHY